MSSELTAQGKTAAVALVVGCAVGLGAGLALGWRLYHPKKILETPAPAVIQQDGSLVLERRPDPAARHQQQIPKGAKVERLVEVRVRPGAATAPTSGSNQLAEDAPAAATPCPDVTVDLSLVRMPDQTRRVIASSPDGQIVGGLDVPVESAAVPRDPKWSVSVLAGYDITKNHRVYGAEVVRTAGPFEMGAGVIGSTVFVKAGIRF